MKQVMTKKEYAAYMEGLREGMEHELKTLRALSRGKVKDQIYISTRLANNILSELKEERV